VFKFEAGYSRKHEARVLTARPWNLMRGTHWTGAQVDGWADGKRLAANLKTKTGNKITRYPFAVTQYPPIANCGNEAVQLTHRPKRLSCSVCQSLQANIRPGHWLPAVTQQWGTSLPCKLSIGPLRTIMLSNIRISPFLSKQKYLLKKHRAIWSGFLWCFTKCFTPYNRYVDTVSYQKPVVFWRNSFYLFLKCLLASNLTTLSSRMLWFGSCNHYILTCFLWSKNRKHSSPSHGLCCFNSYRTRLSLAEVLMFSLMFSQAQFMSSLSLKFSKAAKLCYIS